jgi:hypothetical protein
MQEIRFRSHLEHMTTSEYRRFLAGDEVIAEEVVRRTGRIALPFAVAVLGDRDAAGDVARH